MFRKCFAFVSVFIVGHLHAGVILREDFSYPEGPLVTVAEARWKTHSGTAGQIGVSNGAIQLSQKSSEDVSALFPEGAITATNSTALYLRFKATFTGLPSGPSGAYFAHFKDGAATTGFRCRLFASTNSAPAGCLRLGISAGANTATTYHTADLKLNAASLVVARMTFPDNLSTLWINPRNENDVHVSSTDTVAPKAAVAFAFRQSFSSGSGMGQVAIDDLIIGTRFSDLLAYSPPEILHDPASQDVSVGEDAMFTIEVRSATQVEYQWQHDDVDIPGATSAVLLLQRVTSADAGQYKVVLRTSESSVVSAAAELHVRPAVGPIRLDFAPPWTVLVRWQAEPGQTYSVWAGSDPQHAFEQVAADLWFWDGAGSFAESLPGGPCRFYLVCTP